MNPFKKNNEILPVASINSVYVDNETAYNIFRPAILIKKLEDNREELGYSKSLSGEELLFGFSDLLQSKIPSIREKANELAIEFGDRLASVILTLKKPSELSKKNRPDWTEEHWNYWKDIKQLYLVGGLTSPLLTRVFCERVELALEIAKISDFNVTFIEGSSNLGTKGLANEFFEGEYLLFDFGQTNTKRQHVIKRNGRTIMDSILPSIKSDYLFYKFKDEAELKIIAEMLHTFIKDIVVKTTHEVGFKGDNILISIANYVSNGEIYLARGGYGKLAYLSENYQELLERDLSKRFKKMINVKLYHDTSSMALNFKGESNTAVISLGTAFGVAFLE